MSNYSWLDSLAIRPESKVEPRLSEQFERSLGRLAVQGCPNPDAIYQELSPYKEKIETLEHQGRNDELTGLLNRRGFAEGISLSLSIFSRTPSKIDQSLLVAAIDLDNFKSLNDNFGYYAGDEALVYTAHQLKDKFRRPSDLCARVGGDEFWVVSALTADQAFAWSKSQLNSLVNNIGKFEYGGEKRLGASSGGVIISRAGNPNENQWLEDFKQSFLTAEELLHQAKALGKNKALIKQLDGLN